MVQDANAKEQLLQEVEAAIVSYRRNRRGSTILQWSVLFPVTVAGFFTAAAGGGGGKEVVNAWYATPMALTIWGLIAALGSLVVQTANPAQMAEKFEKKKDAMRAIRTALKFRGLEVAVAAQLVETARADPEQALDDLSSQVK